MDTIIDKNRPATIADVEFIVARALEEDKKPRPVPPLPEDPEEREREVIRRTPGFQVGGSIRTFTIDELINGVSTEAASLEPAH